MAGWLGEEDVICGAQRGQHRAEPEGRSRAQSAWIADPSCAPGAQAWEAAAKGPPQPGAPTALSLRRVSPVRQNRHGRSDWKVWPQAPGSPRVRGALTSVTVPCGMVAKLGEEKVKPLSVPASWG